jgi:hypothetical protein
MTASTVHVTNLTPGSECNPTRGYIVYMVGAPNNKAGKKPVLIRVDSKWAHTHYGQYSGGSAGNGDKMVKTYFAVVRRSGVYYLFITPRVSATTSKQPNTPKQPNTRIIM